ncbi:dicarboxylate/amino acid:cation symporter [Aliidiomarina haloalkalitolerans]|uniref:Dicarboxylate/amino acid:cation symporter n=1 Tax=Aliidiomarina haloalkalitolerans TaxID=859059 RepID=A0A432VQW4_9GAMM|nr:dicarboxylate/amino acid:cation symporter [Aliidiomarina haloalkalitolerans]RUO18656.1 dicarboxylate/amino acid:cation symporter [Aliidiomarina haloalkalitolerans]
MPTKKIGLTGRIVIGMFAGILFGILLNQFAVTPDNWVRFVVVDGVLRVVGEFFITSLMMLVVPLVFVSLVVGTCSMSDPSKLGRIGGKALFLYLITTGIAISIALSVASIVKPGSGGSMAAQEVNFEAAPAPSFVDVLINMVPRNPINAMAEGNMLQIIVFALLFGLAMALVGKPGERLKGFFEDVNEVIMKLVMILMHVAPYGVFALLARTFADLGFGDLLGDLAVYFVTVLVILLVHGFIVYPTILTLLTRLNPMIFVRKMFSNQIFAFSISSSNATIPVTMRTTTKRLGVDNKISSFTVPLGATINMDGTAIMQGVATVFIAQLYGIDLTMNQYLMVILTATLASIGTAGVPGVGLIMLAMVLQQVGLPVEAIGLIIGVDRLLDMTRTAVNITGDAMVTTVIGKSEQQLDEDVYNDPDAGAKVEKIDS